MYLHEPGHKVGMIVFKRETGTSGPRAYGSLKKIIDKGCEGGDDRRITPPVRVRLGRRVVRVGLGSPPDMTNLRRLGRQDSAQVAVGPARAAG